MNDDRVMAPDTQAGSPAANQTSAASGVRPDASRDTDRGPLFAGPDAEGYRTRWGGIQTGFVDEPRHAVEEADALVKEVMNRLTEQFSDERMRLEREWEKSDKISTEDLRQAMHRYRSFFERLLSI